MSGPSRPTSLPGSPSKPTIARDPSTGCFIIPAGSCKTSSSAIPKRSSSRRSALIFASSSTIQVAKADHHRFMLYKTDFLPGTDSVLTHGRLEVQPDVLPACRLGWADHGGMDPRPAGPGRIAPSGRARDPQPRRQTDHRRSRASSARLLTPANGVPKPPTVSTTLSCATRCLLRTTRSRPQPLLTGEFNDEKHVS